nr:MAG TPA: hypothetical protein [Caudoviricetes sp.]
MSLFRPWHPFGVSFLFCILYVSDDKEHSDTHLTAYYNTKMCKNQSFSVVKKCKQL